MKKIKSYFKTLIINFGILLGLLVVVELFFGAWIWQGNQLENIGVIRNAQFTFNPNKLYNIDSTITYTRDYYGLRGASCFDTPSEIDVLTIGGSTTDQSYISDADTWQEILEDSLRSNGSGLKLSNAGVDGQSTFGHIACFESWFPLVPDLKPKYVVFYIGVNDFVINKSARHFDKMGEGGRLKDIIKRKSALYNFYRKIKGHLLSKKYQVGHQKIDFDTKKYTKTGLLDDYSFFEKNLPYLQERVKLLIKYSKALGAKPIFIIQPSFLYKIENDTLWGLEETFELRGETYNGIDYYNMYQLQANAIKQAAKGEAVIDIIDNEAWNHPEDYYDYYHLTPSGTRRLAAMIFQEIYPILK